MSRLGAPGNSARACIQTFKGCAPVAEDEISGEGRKRSAPVSYPEIVFQCRRFYLYTRIAMSSTGFLQAPEDAVRAHGASREASEVREPSRGVPSCHTIVKYHCARRKHKSKYTTHVQRLRFCLCQDVRLPRHLPSTPQTSVRTRIMIIQTLSLQHITEAPGGDCSSALFIKTLLCAQPNGRIMNRMNVCMQCYFPIHAPCTW